ncbi:MAG: hypothetical protein ACI9HE_002108 [Planctomycetota bacterium]|jgi:hypothetical protein
MSPRTYVRRRKLIKPRLQLKLTGLFVGLSALSLLLQLVLVTNRISHVALELPSDGAVLLGLSSSVLLDVLAGSFLVFLPLTLLVGVIATFRIAGPLYRIEMFLNAVEAGECPPDFHLRKKDELQDLAAQLVRVTRPLRVSSSDSESTESTEADNQAA